MSEEELELLITLDDPADGPEEDNFHRQAKDALEYCFGQRCQVDQPVEGGSENDVFKVTFGQGDWTCTLSRLSGATSASGKVFNENLIKLPNTKFDIEFCTITHRKNGKIVEQKVFYDLVGMQKQTGIM